MAVISRRDICINQTTGERYQCGDNWVSWQRWLVLALAVGGFLLFFVLFSFISARRRRRNGGRPFYGTGWAAPRYHQPPPPAPYYHNPDSQPAPPYSPPSEQPNMFHQPSPVYDSTRNVSDPTRQSGYEMNSHPMPPNPTYQPPRAEPYLHSDTSAFTHAHTKT